MCNWRANPSKAWQSIDLRTVCALTVASKKPTLLEKSRKLAYWQDRNLSRRKMLSSEHENGCRSSASPGCDQPSPSCSPRASRAQNLSSRVFYLFYFFISIQKNTRKKGASNQTPFFFLCDKCELTAESQTKKKLEAQPRREPRKPWWEGERDRREHFFFFEMSPEERKQKKNSKMNWSLIPVSVLQMVCFSGLKRLL